MECQKVRNQNGMNNEKKIMDKKVRIIFFTILSVFVWIIGLFVWKFIVYSPI